MIRDGKGDDNKYLTTPGSTLATATTVGATVEESTSAPTTALAAATAAVEAEKRFRRLPAMERQAILYLDLFAVFGKVYESRPAIRMVARFSGAAVRFGECTSPRSIISVTAKHRCIIDTREATISVGDEQPSYCPVPRAERKFDSSFPTLPLAVYTVDEKQRRIHSSQTGHGAASNNRSEQDGRQEH